MSPVKKTDSQIVYRFPLWVRVLGVICFLGAAGFGYAFIVVGILDNNIAASILFALCAFGFFLGGVYCCKTTKVTFDHTSGRIDIRKCLGPFRWGTIHALKEQMEKVTVENAADLAWGWLIYQSGEEAVSMRIKGRKKPINIITLDDAADLAFRIEEFLIG